MGLPTYLLEFLMLFLAVFLGFIAENIREDFVERKKEKEYIHSMISDLKTDTAKLSEVIAGYQQIILMQDTLLQIFSSLNNGFKVIFYRNFNGTSGYPDFIYTDATIQQLKNSGGFRIFRNRKDIDSIMAYDGKVKRALINEGSLSRDFEVVGNLNPQIFNFLRLSEQMQQGKSPEKLEIEKFDWLLTHDENILSGYYSHLRHYRGLCHIIMSDMKEVKAGATGLITYLEQEYNLQ